MSKKINYISNLIYEYYRDGILDIQRLENVMVSKNSSILYENFNKLESLNLMINPNDDENKILERVESFCGIKK